MHLEKECCSQYGERMVQVAWSGEVMKKTEQGGEISFVAYAPTTGNRIKQVNSK